MSKKHSRGAGAPQCRLIDIAQIEKSNIESGVN